MPLNPEILLGYRPAQVQDPAESMQRMISLRQMMEEAPIRRELQQQQLESGRQDLALNQQKMDLAARSLRSQQRAQEIIGQFGGDIEKALPDLSREVDPDTFKSIRQGHVQVQKDLAAADKDKFDLMVKTGEQMSVLYREATALPDDQYLANWGAIRARAQQINPKMQLPEQPVPKADLIAQYGLGLQTNETYLKNEKEKRDAALHKPAVDKAAADALAAQQKANGTEPLQPKDILTIDQTSARDKALATHRAGTLAETKRGHDIQASHYKAVEGIARMKTGADPELAQAVLDNPLIWETLTPTKRTAISATLAANGFDHFGKALEAGAVKDIAQSKGALDQLDLLQSKLKGNTKYLGPIAGLQSLNPWSDAKKILADLDLTRQNVGKALEGGVLRKEDEEKYKKILSTVFDIPDLAESKLEGLKVRIQRDMDIYKQELRASGRRVNDGGKPPANTSGGGRPAAPGATPASNRGGRLKFNPATGMVE